ncbi:MAG: DUF4136 domain-containing protein [Bacteroidales bacterium]
MNKIFLFASLILITALYGCAPQINSFSDYNRTTNLKKYKSYAWVAPVDSSLVKQQIQGMYGDMIMNMSNEELKKKGMVLNIENPDAVFSVDLGATEKTVYSQAPSVSVGVGVGGPGYYVGGSVPVAGGEITENTVREAFLYIRMFDTKTGALLWTGGATKTMNNQGDPLQNFKTAINYIFRRLPVKHKIEK